MKRKIIGLILCISLSAAVFAGCGFISSPDSETVPADVTETTQGEESTDESSAETEAQEQTTEPAAEAETSAPKDEFSNGVYDNGQITLTLPDGWSYDESMGTPMFISSGEPVNGIQTNLNVVVINENEGLFDTSEEDFRSIMEETFGTGIKIKAFEKKEIGGKATLYSEYSITFNEITQNLTQISYNEDGKNVTYTYVSGSDETPAECIEIFKTLKLL